MEEDSHACFCRGAISHQGGWRLVEVDSAFSTHSSVGNVESWVANGALFQHFLYQDYFVNWNVSVCLATLVNDQHF